ncbi:hypothetical protein NDU88_004255 [Pleurodeles waltl]|uniref:Uncharacterized protein n=1 Tax=Pleurodeles waltl TaxID=8319 RepID=A0AAV7RL06_PLEWA|nr:hypothetical protein NDU88_004255 [Pleurodeles waltl]
MQRGHLPASCCLELLWDTVNSVGTVRTSTGFPLFGAVAGYSELASSGFCVGTSSLRATFFIQKENCVCLSTKTSQKNVLLRVIVCQRLDCSRRKRHGNGT